MSHVQIDPPASKSEAPKCCRKCGAGLILGESISASAMHNQDYTCRECSTIRARKYREANPEAHRGRVRKWRAENLEAERERNRAWKRQHPEQRRVSEATKRARKRCATIGDLSAVRDLEAHRWAAEGFAGCSMHLDHITPLSRGGAHSADNLRYLPARLNLIKGDKLDSEVTAPEFRRWVDSGPVVEQVTYAVRRRPRLPAG